jgi:hypothetical protein
VIRAGRVNRMAHRTALPPRPTAPTLTLEQKRYRIERFQVCIKRLEDFDPEKVRRRVGVPEVVTLEAGIEKDLSATFGYGTPSILFRGQSAIDTFPRAKRDRSPCSARRFAHSKRKHPTRATAANGRGHLPPIHFAAKSLRTIAPDGREHYEVVIFGSNDAVPQGPL